MTKIAIIGAGVGGLSTGIYLQNAGYEVDIYEKNGHSGGKMDRIEANGFKFDTGPTIVMMPDIYQKPFTDTGVNYNDYFSMVRVNPFMSVITGNKQIPLSSDLVDIAKSFEVYGEAEMLGFLKYLTDIYAKYINAKNNFIYRSFRGPKDFFNLKTLWHAYQLKTFSSSYEAIKKNINHTDLQYLMSFQTLYIGISPFSGPSIYNIIPMIELVYGVWYIQGGMFEYAKALEKRFIELGGHIHFNSEVQHINVSNHQHVTGLQIHDETISTDAVVANADFPYTMSELIAREDNLRGRYTPQKIQKLDYSMSCFLLYLGIDKQYDGKQLHTIKMADDFEKNINDIEAGILPDDPSFYVYNPSTIDPTFAPVGQSSLYILVPVANLKANDDWDEDTVMRFADSVITQVSHDLEMPDLSEHIVYQKIFTPKIFENRYHSFFGSTFGLKPTLKQSNYFRPHNKHATIDNLYFAGASVHPGAGVPIVLTSGELTAKEVMRDFND